MGLFSKATSFVSKSTGGLLGGSGGGGLGGLLGFVSGGGSPVGTLAGALGLPSFSNMLTGGSGGGSLKDLLLGEMGPGTKADPSAKFIRANQLKALQQQEDALDRLTRQGARDPEEFLKPLIEARAGGVRLGAERQIKGLQAGLGDRRRQLQSQIARKGLGRSAVGLSALANLDKPVQEQIAGIRAQIPVQENLIRAQLPSLAHQQRLLQSQQVLGGTRGALSTVNVPTIFRDIPGQRSGGLLPLLTAGAGGALGSLVGAPLAGAGIGGGLGQGLLGASR